MERRESLFPMQMLPSNYINDVVRCVPRAVCLAGSLKDQRDALNNIIAREGRRPIAGVALKRLTPNHVLRGGAGGTETLLFYFVILGERGGREIPSQEGGAKRPARLLRTPNNTLFTDLFFSPKMPGVMHTRSRSTLLSLPFVAVMEE